MNAGYFIVAGVEGFEPPNAWTKTMCLTTWRHPNVCGTVAEPLNGKVVVHVMDGLFALLALCAQTAMYLTT